MRNPNIHPVSESLAGRSDIIRSFVAATALVGDGRRRTTIKLDLGPIQDLDAYADLELSLRLQYKAIVLESTPDNEAKPDDPQAPTFAGTLTDSPHGFPDLDVYIEYKSTDLTDPAEPLKATSFYIDQQGQDGNSINITEGKLGTEQEHAPGCTIGAAVLQIASRALETQGLEAVLAQARTNIGS